MTAREILVDRSAAETRVAIIEDGRLRELLVERVSRPWRLGQVVVARVTAVRRGQCFLDLGGSAGVLDRGGGNTVHEGASLAVQVRSEARRGKAARVSTGLGLDGKFVSLVPDRAGTSVSRRIVDAGKRERLRRAVADLAPDGAGIIVRATAGNRRCADVAADARAVVHRLLRVREKAGEEPVGTVLDSAPGPVARSRLRAPSALLREGRDGELFDDFGVEDALELALRRTVAMPDGLRLVIEETEALNAIDIDIADGTLTAGRAVVLGAELAWQVRLRQLAGLIMIDVPRARRVRDRVADAFAAAFDGEPDAPAVHGWTRTGVLEVTRPRGLPTLNELYAGPDDGVRPSAETVACDVLRRMPGRVRTLAHPRVRCAPEVAALMTGSLRPAVVEVARRLGCEPRFEAVSGLPHGEWWIDGE